MKLQKTVYPILFYALCVLLFTNCASDDDDGTTTFEPEYEAEVSHDLEDVPYGSHERQVADIYLPEGRNTEETKFILLIHGGAWISGDKEDVAYIADMAKSQYPDYAIVNMNYRFPNNENTAFPMQIDDVEMLVNHLNENRDDYVISEKMGIIGVSAGAHLSLMYAYDRDPNQQVEAVCSIVGPTDFTDENYLNSAFYDTFRETLIGNYEYDENPEKFEEVSPVHSATNMAPPTVMFYGDEDPLVPTSQGPRLEAKLNELGVYNELYLYEGVGHADWDVSGFLDVQQKMISFFDEFLEE